MTEEDEGQAWEYWHGRAIAAEAALYQIICLNHHNHGPESKAATIARAVLTRKPHAEDMDEDPGY